MNRLEFDSIELSVGGRNLLSSIYMLCEKGKITALLGRNGCGKSTLLKVVFGAIRSHQKSIRIDGRSIGMDYLKARFIAYLPQNDLVPSYLSMRNAVSLFGIPESEITDVFPEAEAFMHLRPSQLSGGYLRLFEVLLIVRSRTPFCLLDEPFTGLAPVYIERIRQILLKARLTKGILITDHFHRHVTDIADHLYILTNGCTSLITRREQLITFGYLNRL